MKVIKPGNIAATITCKSCNAELEFEPKDVKHIVSESLRDEGEVTVHVIDCPECMERIDISGLKLPPIYFLKS